MIRELINVLFQKYNKVYLTWFKYIKVLVIIISKTVSMITTLLKFIEKYYAI